MTSFDHLRRLPLALLIAVAGCGGAAEQSPRATVVPVAPAGAPAGGAAPARGEPVIVREPALYGYGRDISPDGALLARYAFDLPGLQIFGRSGRYLATLETDGVPSGSILFSPDSRGILARTRGSGAFVWDAIGPKLVGKLPYDYATVSDDGRYVIIVHRDEDMRLVDLAGPSITPLPGSRGKSPVTISPSGKLVLVKNGDDMSIHVLPSFERRATYPWTDAFGISADDRFLGLKKDVLVAVEIRGGAEHKISDAARDPAWSAKGALVAFRDRRTDALRVWDPTQPAAATVAAERGWNRWLGDGRLLAVSTKEERWVVHDLGGKPPLEIVEPTRRQWAVSPGGDALVTWASQEPVHVFDTRTGARTATDEALASGGCDARFAAGGAPLLYCAEYFIELSTKPPATHALVVRSPSARFAGPKQVTATCARGISSWSWADGAPAFVAAPPERTTEWTAAGPLNTRTGKSALLRVARTGAIVDLKSAVGRVHDDGARVASFTPDDKGVLVFDLGKPDAVGAIATKYPVGEVRWHPRLPILFVRVERPSRPPQVTIHAYDASDAAHPVEKATFSATDVLAAPAGTRFVTGGRGPRSDLWDAADWKRVGTVENPMGSIASLSFSPDGERMVVVDPGSDPAEAPRPQDVRVLDAQGRAIVHLVTPMPERASWSGDGATVWVESVPAQRALLLTGYDAITGSKQREVQLTGDIAETRWIADGRAIAVVYGSQPTELRRLADGKVLRIGVSVGGGRCGLFAYDDEGHFDGDPDGAIHVRIGDDLRTAEYITAAPLLDRYRRPGLIASFLAGR